MLPTVTVAQMREVDRLATEEFGIALAQMMENAGRALAELTRRHLGGDVRGRRVAVLAGRGGNGGGGLAAARRLAIWGAEVRVVMSRPGAAFQGEPARQLEILRHMRVPAHEAGAGDGLLRALGSAEVVLDAVIGYGLRGAPHEPDGSLIRATVAASVPVLALDVPSSMDADTGVPWEPAVRAMATLTLALPKTGLLAPEAWAWTGQLYLADISVPPAVYRRLGLDVGPVFARSDLLPLGRDGQPVA